MSGAVSTLVKKRAQAAGLGSNNNAVKYMNQDFQALKNKCLSSRRLFCDPIFQPVPESLGYKELGPNSEDTIGVEWKRPGELISAPQFIVGGATRTDICQGILGDCWLMAAIACLTLDQDILAGVIYPDQSFDKDYAGIFHFRLWQYGQWVDVVIDDLLPTKEGKLLFVHSTDRNEFWSALLEKAYAKLNGSYEALDGGLATEAFEDFTGGVAETYDLKKAPPNLFSIMKEALCRGSLLSTNITAGGNETETETEEELVKNHVYSITATEEVHFDGNQVQLLRLRNPWGHTEWNGAWSDNSMEWKHVLPEEAAKLNYSAEDGEFWMALSDFVQQYSRLEICNLSPDALNSKRLGQWALQQFEGSWRAGCSAGGCSNNKDTFWTNPQYKITLLEEDNDSQNHGAGCTFLVSLMQKNRRRYRKEGQATHYIGFDIYEVPVEFRGSQNVRLKNTFFLDNSPTAESGNCANTREVSQRFQLPPGEYLIIPSTFDAGEEADFILRVFTEKQVKMQEMCSEVSYTLCNEVGVTQEDIDTSFRDMFVEYSGTEMMVSVEEFRTILNRAMSNTSGLKTASFSLEDCKCMVELMDSDDCGRLSLVDFQMLWNKIMKWRDIFLQFDLDKSGTMSSYEMSLALESAGFNLDNDIIEALVKKYRDKQTICFDKFIVCLVRLEDTFTVAQMLDPDRTGVIKLDISDWVRVTM